MGFHLQHKYQDSGWMHIVGAGLHFEHQGDAEIKAQELASDSISWGMVRVLDAESGDEVATFAAGGDRIQ